ncbi:MAG: NAD(P)H-dependent oxidoreductase [Gammaproteobacteria bacterium]|nr:NAD(P)H-dependent oxidoreductase [Gammaproteobacteria bacterium]
MKFLLIAASLRKDALNKKLIRNVERILNAVQPDIEHKILDLNDYPMPAFDGDIQEHNGIPASVKALGEEISQAQAIIIATPEYNGGIPGHFKNTADWVSRLKPNPWANKAMLLMCASPGGLAGIRGLWHTRVPFEAMGVHVYPTLFGLPNAGDAFDANNVLHDTKIQDRLTTLLTDFSQLTKKYNAYIK